MTEDLNGTTEKISACAIKANAQQKQENEKDIIVGIISVETILFTRLPEENFNDLFNSLKAIIRSSATDEDIKKALVSSKRKF